jgi:oxygen-dependent protoporphyrinogen oxidase
VSAPVDVVVIGGGIAGLTAAWTARRAGLAVSVLEASDRAGGKLWSSPFHGHLVDRGADAFLARVPDAVALCEELGLGRELVPPARREAYVLHQGSLHRFPEGLVLGVPTDLAALAASGLVSDAGLARAAADFSDPAPPVDGDTTVGAYVRQRIGDEVVDAFVSPLLSGINAGDADELSLDAGAPQLAAVAHAGGSLIEGLRAQRAQATTDPDAPIFYSLTGGVGRLSATLAERLAEQLLYRVGVTAIERTADGYRLTLTNGTALDAPAVVLAVPAPVAASLLAPLAADVSGELAALEYAGVTVTTLAFADSAIGRPLDGTGFLVPEGEGRLVTACSWGSGKWPHWASHGTAVLRVSTGRHHDRRDAELDDAALVDAVLADLTDVLGLTDPPVATTVTRWPAALPQYRPGHLDRLAAWETTLAERTPGLVLAGAATRGLGIPACVASGRRAAQALSPA